MNDLMREINHEAAPTDAAYGLGKEHGRQEGLVIGLVIGAITGALSAFFSLWTAGAIR